MHIPTSHFLASLALAIAGCASTPQSRDISAEAIPSLRQARVVVAAPGASVGSSARTDPGVDPLAAVSTVGLTPAQSVSGPGIVGGAIAMGIIGLIIGGDLEAQRTESKALLARDGQIPNQNLAQLMIQGELGKLKRRVTPIQITEVVASDGEAAVLSAVRGVNSAAMVKVTANQTMSLDLSRLRVHIKVTATRGDGSELMELNIFYLPVSIPGVTKEDSMRVWKRNDYQLYREQLEHGAGALADALDALFFSRAAHRQDFLGDAQPLLRRTNCYGGDYDAGIPLSAYKGGRILPSRSSIALIKLENGDVLAFPQCQS